MIAEKNVFIAQDILFNNQNDNCYYGLKFSLVMKMSWQWKGVFLFGIVYGLHEMYETECNYNVISEAKIPCQKCGKPFVLTLPTQTGAGPKSPQPHIKSCGREHFQSPRDNESRLWSWTETHRWRISEAASMDSKESPGSEAQIWNPLPFQEPETPLEPLWH